jgi:energy-converting hydrogenase Eha subunit G
MITPNIDGKQIVNAIYHGAVVGGLAIASAKLIHMVVKRAALPKLDADKYDIMMLVLDTSIALAIRDVLIRQGIIPPDIMK